MGLARDRSPDPGRVRGAVRPPLSPRPPLCSPARSEPRVSSGSLGDPPGSRDAIPASTPPSTASPPSGRQPKLLDRLREALRSRHYSPRTEHTYCHWVKRFIFFHNVRHPAEMGEPEVNAFLTFLAMKGKVSASTQNQALSALLFLYRYVLDRLLGQLGEVVRARNPHRLPVVLTRQEVRAVLSRLEGDKWLMASLMYGAGLRLAECLRLRVQDVDLEANQILVRDGKGFRDRLTMLPEAVKGPLADHLENVKRIHTRDVADGYGRVALPDALARKYPKAAWEWRWQHVFPQEHRWVNARAGEQGRYHMDESLIQRAVKVAVHSAGIAKHATCHTLRHSGVYPALVRGDAPHLPRGGIRYPDHTGVARS